MIDRAIDVTGGFGFELEGVRIVNGAPPASPPGIEGGGGLRWLEPASAAPLVVTDSSFAANTGLGGGSAIEAETAGDHTIAGSKFTGNFSGYATIRSTGELSLTDSTIAGNGGGGLAAEGTLLDRAAAPSRATSAPTPRVGGILAERRRGDRELDDHEQHRRVRRGDRGRRGAHGPLLDDRRERRSGRRGHRRRGRHRRKRRRPR